MSWATFGGSEFFIPAGIQIDARCPLSRSITEWYPEWRGSWGREGYLCSALPSAGRLSQNSRVFSPLSYFLAITTKSLPVEKSNYHII